MNLFETQERLNALPPSPQTLQYLSAAAEGQNPNVPPWLALVRMTEIQKEMQAAQQMQQAPQGEQPQAPTVKDQVQQASGIMTLQQQKQQAAMQQVAQQAAQGQPQQPPAGIAAVAPQAFRHGGGVRHFQYGGGINPMLDYREQLERERAEEAEARAREAEQRSRYEELARRAMPTPEDPSVIQRREEQAMGVDPRRAFDEQQRRVQELQQRMQQEQATREQERGRMGQQNLFSSLIAAREGTRGARGSGLAGLMSGFGQSYMQGDQAIMAERRKSEDAMLKRQAEINELLGGVDTARMGAADKATDRGYGYSTTKAKAEGQQQTNELGAAKDIYQSASQTLGKEDRGSTELMGRAIANATGRTQIVGQELGLLRADVTSTQRSIDELTKTIKGIEGDYRKPLADKIAEAKPHQEQLAAQRRRLAQLQDTMDKLRKSLNTGYEAPSAQGGASAPVGASGSSTPTGGTIDPRLEAARFRERFPATR